MERGLKDYLEELKSDVASLVYSDGEGASFEDKFTEDCLEKLDSIGKSEGARILSYVHPNSTGGIEWKLNGYCLKDQFKDDDNKTYFETLDLFITYFKNDDYEYNIGKDDFNKSLNQVKKFLNAALKKHIDYIDKSHTELYELIKVIERQGTNFDRINIFYLINGVSKHDVEKVTLKGFDNLDIFVQVWDILRFYRIYETNSNREPIAIDFNKFSDNDIVGLQCLKVPSVDEMYDCYLSIIPGSILAKLYNEYSNELLESNVRAFLGQTGKFNKGIRDTIREKPQMFLPYNNGITATAETVVVKTLDNKQYITNLNDFQIVNGGQTTASLYHTQKKYKDVDLEKIFVQMKLTVIKDINQKNIEVPNISRFANSQNKVSELDLSSNNPFFVQIETLSRRKYVNNPENRNQPLLWFFERASGQYKETLNKQTPTQQKQFKVQCPSNLKFEKSEVAKFINLWEQEPHFVAQGAQKNFIHYTKKINELVKKNRLPGEYFYKKLIANAIIFKTVDKLYGRKGVNAIGDTNLKSYIVAYSIAFFHYHTDKRLDLWKIYEEQIIDNRLQSILKSVLQFVYDFLISQSVNSLISEFAKKESTWNLLKNEYYDDIINKIPDFFVPKETSIQREMEKEIDDEDTENTIFIISEIKKLGLKFWDGCQKYVDTNQIEGLPFIGVFDVRKKIKENKNLTNADIAVGKKVLRLIENAPELYEEIKNKSEINEVNTIDLKAIYDKLKLLSNDNWDRIISLSEQTHILEPLELSNLKSVRNSMKNQAIKPKEQAFQKAYLSILKLSKFGVKI